MKQKRVIVDVIGGVANVWQVPPGVIVEIRDYDNGSMAMRGDPMLKKDKDGNRYCAAIYTKENTI